MSQGDQDAGNREYIILLLSAADLRGRNHTETTYPQMSSYISAVYTPLCTTPPVPGPCNLRHFLCTRYLPGNDPSHGRPTPAYPEFFYVDRKSDPFFPA